MDQLADQSNRKRPKKTRKAGFGVKKGPQMKVIARTEVKLITSSLVQRPRLMAFLEAELTDPTDGGGDVSSESDSHRLSPASE